MGRKVCLVVLCALVTIGAIVLVGYPVMKELRFQREQERELVRYRQTLAQTQADQLAIHRALARWYNFTLEEDPDNEELAQFYDRIGNLEEGSGGWVMVPELKWQVPVYYGNHSRENVVHHDPSSAFPLGIPGDRTVVMIPNNKIFTRLKPGMEVGVSFLGTEFTLRVLDPGQGGTLVLKAQGSGAEIHCGYGSGPVTGKTGIRDISWLCGAVGAWTLPAAAAALSKGLRRRKKPGKRQIIRANH